MLISNIPEIPAITPPLHYIIFPIAIAHFLSCPGFQLDAFGKKKKKVLAMF